MALQCKYDDYPEGGYGCSIEDQEIPSEVSEETFQGDHNENHTNDDVRVLFIENSKLEKIPDGIGDVFKNLTYLQISYSNLKEVSKEDLRQFPNLEELNLDYNRLEYLPGDLFEFNKELREISLAGNEIKLIGPELLDGLQNLITVDFNDNQNISICNTRDNRRYDGSKFSLNKIKEEIKSKCKPPELLLKQNICGRLKDLDKFLAHDGFKDFTIKVGPREFKVHKFIFLARSPTFAEMIKNNPDADELVLTDIPVEVFESILDFVYTDKPPRNPRNAREIFAAAGKLKIENLIDISAEILMKEIENGKNLDFLLENFDLGAKLECQKLKLKAFEGIKRKFGDTDLKDDLLERPEKLRKIVKTKILLDEQLNDSDEDEATTSSKN